MGRRAARFGARVGARARVSARVQRTLSGAAARSSPLPGLLSPSPSQSGFQTFFASEMRDQTACSRQAGLSRARAVSRSPGFLRNHVLAPCLVSASSRRVARLFDEIACSRRPPVVLLSRARAVFVRLEFRVLAFLCLLACSLTLSCVLTCLVRELAPACLRFSVRFPVSNRRVVVGGFCDSGCNFLAA